MIMHYNYCEIMRSLLGQLNCIVIITIIYTYNIVKIYLIEITKLQYLIGFINGEYYKNTYNYR